MEIKSIGIESNDIKGVRKKYASLYQPVPVTRTLNFELKLILTQIRIFTRKWEKFIKACPSLWEFALLSSIVKCSHLNFWFYRFLNLGD